MHENTQHIHYMDPLVTSPAQGDRFTLHTLCLAALQTYQFLSGTSPSCPADSSHPGPNQQKQTSQDSTELQTAVSPPSV